MSETDNNEKSHSKDYDESPCECGYFYKYICKAWVDIGNTVWHGCKLGKQVDKTKK